ncbi:MAG: multiheme c-type cytochrome, partial [Candidatus Bathyarchaeia archaeon]
MFMLVSLPSALNPDADPFIVAGAEAQSSEGYLGPEFCVTCHAPQYSEWNRTAHSRAFTDPTFQGEWSDMGSPGDCLQCHTTGYDPSTGNY